MGAACSTRDEARPPPSSAAHKYGPADEGQGKGRDAAPKQLARTNSSKSLLKGTRSRAASLEPHAAAASPKPSDGTEADGEAEADGVAELRPGHRNLASTGGEIDPEQLTKLKLSTLRSSMLAECLNSEQLRLLAQLGELRKFSAIGERIVEQGSKADAVYLVHRGEVLLRVRDAELDNTPNSALIAQLSCEQTLQPLVDASGKDWELRPPPDLDANLDDSTPQPVPLSIPSASPKRAPMPLPSPSRALHPASIARSSHGGELLASSVAATRLTNPALTRAEQLALEAHALIEATAAEGDGELGQGGRDSLLGVVGGGVGKSNKRMTLTPQGSPSLAPAAAPSTPSFNALPAAAPPGADLPALDQAELLAHVPPFYTSDKHSLFVCVKGAQQIFGHEGVFFASDKRYLFSALNNSPATHLIVLQRKHFDQLFKQWPDRKEALLACLGGSLQSALSETPWLSERVVPPQKLPLLASLFHHASVHAGTMLFEEGTVCSDDSPLYFLLSGSVELEITNEKGHKLTKQLQSGALFGELGVMLGFSITASARTVEPCVLRLCKRRWLSLFCMLSPSLMPALRESAIKSFRLRDEQLLDNVHVQASFTEFCLKEFNAENLEFWSTAVRFRKITVPQLFQALPEHEAREALLAEAALLYNRYVSEMSVLQININSSVREQIKESLQSGEVGKELFLAAEREICALMLADTFTRFKATSLYSAALSMLAAPSPCPILLGYANLAASSRSGAGGGAGIRAKEYSRTEQGHDAVGPLVATTPPAGKAAMLRRMHSHMNLSSGGGFASGGTRQLSLDSVGEHSAASKLLMFGGADKYSSSPTGAAGGVRRGSVLGAAASGPNGRRSQLQIQASSREQEQAQGSSEANPLLTPPAGPASPSEAALPRTTLQLSPTTDQFRVQHVAHELRQEQHAQPHSPLALDHAGAAAPAESPSSVPPHSASPAPSAASSTVPALDDAPSADCSSNRLLRPSPVSSAANTPSLLVRKASVAKGEQPEAMPLAQTA